jgi:hypothetical protein
MVLVGAVSACAEMETTTWDETESIGDAEQAATVLVNCPFTSGLCSGLLEDLGSENQYGSKVYDTTNGILKARVSSPSSPSPYNPGRSRFEVVKKELVAQNDGYELKASVRFRAPTTTWEGATNQGGDVLQLMQYDQGPNCTADKKYKPIYMFVLKANGTIEIARWINGTKGTTTVSGNYYGTSWHTIEVTARISNSSNGYWTTKLNGTQVDTATGITTMDGGVCRVGLKSGNYTGGQVTLWKSEIYIDDLYAEKDPLTSSNPCAAYCASPTVFTTTNYSSGNLGTGATCHETTANIVGANCGNMGSRTFKVNGVTQTCTGNITLPAKVNGGYCFQATAGTPDYAYFGTW